MPGEKVDLGHNHFYTKYTIHGDDENRWAGIIESHPNKKDPSKTCSSSVAFDVDFYDPSEGGRFNRPVWQVQNYDPLTLSPSLLCNVCGEHGFIQNGKWVQS